MFLIDCASLNVNYEGLKNVLKNFFKLPYLEIKYYIRENK